MAKIHLDMTAPNVAITGVMPDQVSLLAFVTPIVTASDTVDLHPTVTATLSCGSQATG